MISEYLKERGKWKKFGSPLRKPEEIVELFEICLSCPQFQKKSEVKGSCDVCGCHIKREGTFLNKLAWGTTRCPMSDPKWKESEDRFAKETHLTPEELNQAEKEHKRDLQKEKAPNCGCH